MKTTVNWLVLRGQRSQSVQECSLKAEDLGRREHVVKVLLETFRGAAVDAEDVLWVQPAFEIRFKPEAAARPRRIDVVVSMSGIGCNEVISAMSTKARGQLRERRLWQFFDAATEEPIRWNPPSRQPLSKKGLVAIEISTETFLRHAQSGPGTYLWLSLGTVSEVGAFIDRAPLEPKDAVTLGWQNLEVITPLGTHLFGLHFGGQGRDSAKTRVRQFAVELGRSIATLDNGIFTVAGTPPEVAESSMCKRLLHDVWEDSLQRGGVFWRQAFVAYNPERLEATRHLATVTVQQSVGPTRE